MKQKMKVLVVDDEPKNIRIIEEMLEFEGEYICRAAANGEECLSLLAPFQPDVILLDVMMPGSNGYEVCRKIKKDPVYNSVKIILVSGRAMASERREGFEAGADGYITKPFEEDELLAAIK